MAENRGLAVEMTLRGRNDETQIPLFQYALGSWKPAQNAGFHIPTPTAAAGVRFEETANPAKIAGLVRFLCRTEILKQEVAKWEEAAKAVEGFISRVAEVDRAYLKERAEYYRANAQDIRKFLEKKSVA